jgi:hypothetical protein
MMCPGRFVKGPFKRDYWVCSECAPTDEDAHKMLEELRSK